MKPLFLPDPREGHDIFQFLFCNLSLLQESSHGGLGRRHTVSDPSKEKDPDRPPLGPFALPKVHPATSYITGIVEFFDLRLQLLRFPLEKEKLRGLVTELHYPEVMHFMDKKTVRWKFLKSLEPPRVVHARQSHFITKTNVFAQVTVRLHTQQVLAVYDRFGRLEFGSETTAKDVLEYCVFERHLSALYGEWRLHGKIVPSWAKPKESLPRTFVIPQHARSGLPKPESLRPSGHPSSLVKFCVMLVEYSDSEGENEAPPTRLPLPSVFSPPPPPETANDDDRHGGRVRTFPHERGNWASFVFIPIPTTPAVQELREALCKRSAGVLKPCDEPLHLSLSRTVVLRHPWIQPLAEALRTRLSSVPSFDLSLDLETPSVLVNEEGTRTFVTLEATARRRPLEAVVQFVDERFGEYGLPGFYPDRRFHVSLVWCLGKQEDLCERLVQEALRHPDLDEELWIHVDHVALKAGNQLHRFPLKNTT
ncbi:unnamed protein product [Cyprideis torosa]|uniref:U6 snRNA phosphodiesterase n=1 Tax=Cyprideis torosa TaxID=163714 RepID=A0A7R8W3R1_9CRUS|nr:unnamed protein product [Cyprideis torosa]CAG0882383.1 unnamed protein product [Cyprideis torosa]